MLEVISEKGPLEILPGTKITFIQDFNLHDFEAARDVKSWSWKLAKTPTNIERMNWLGLADASRGGKDHVPVEVRPFSKLWRKGPLYLVDEGDESNYDVSFTGDMGAFLALIEGKSLRDFDYPSVFQVDWYGHALQTVTDPIGDHDYIFAPVDLPSLRGDVWWPAQINSVTVDANGDLSGFPQFWRSFDAPDYDPNRIALENSSIGYLSGAIVKFEGLYYTNPNNVAIGRSPNTHPGEWTQVTQGNSRRYNPLVPMFYVYSILQHIADNLGIRFGGKIWDDPEMARLVFFNTVCLNEMEEYDPGVVPGNSYMDYRNHIPDMPLRDFLKEFAKFFNQKITYIPNTNTLNFSHRMDVLNNDGEFLLKDRVISKRNLFREKRIYSLGFRSLGSDQNHQGDTWPHTLEGISGGEGANPVMTEFGTLPMREGFTEVDINHVEFVGDDDNSWFPGNGFRPVSGMQLNAEVPKQFLFYRGFRAYPNPLISWPNIPLLPHLSSDLDYISPGVGHDRYTLLWQGTGGLYETWWKTYLDALKAARPMEMRVLIDAELFNRVNLLKKQGLDKYMCLVEKMEINMGKDDDQVIADLQVLKL